jgi:NAD(P)-dependent dehydrogenase (short-subunit alcohol dehydrogenase family)
MSESSPVLLLTGASSGIGAASARLLVGEGWRLILAARSIGKLDELAEELGGPDHAVAVECDVTEWADQQAAVTVALEQEKKSSGSLMELATAIIVASCRINRAVFFRVPRASASSAPSGTHTTPRHLRRV